jgi:hypothetical protein
VIKLANNPDLAKMIKHTINAINATTICSCGGDYLYTGEEKTSYPAGLLWKCNRCGETGRHYGVFDIEKVFDFIVYDSVDEAIKHGMGH